MNIENKREKVLQVRVDEATMNKVTLLAEAEDITVSRLLRNWLHEKLENLANPSIEMRLVALEDKLKELNKFREQIDERKSREEYVNHLEETT